uniref:Uncharacterized protein n=1 Tax=Micromonas pusilla TaxID=38833 RepID=A0A7S0I8M3_MICPS|mmetsp:Transcript_11922/g.50102  ORF Transcript_11922/g.50102 Transcript_11922/m.50102 type:complete len:667 (+) Transcript_11922:47-2047(+)
MDLLAAEIARKRKAKAEEFGGAKYVKRSQISAAREAKIREEEEEEARPFFRDGESAVIDVGTLLRDDLARLAGLDVDPDAATPTAPSSNDAPPSGLPPLPPGGAVDRRRASSTSSRKPPWRRTTSRDAPATRDTHPNPNPNPKPSSPRTAVRLLVELAHRAARAGLARDAGACERVILPALRLLRGVAALPSACRGRNSRAALAMNGLARARSPREPPSVAARAIAIRVARAWRRRCGLGFRGRVSDGRVALAGFGSEVLLGADDGDRSENSRREFEGEPTTFASATSVRLAATTTTTTTTTTRTRSRLTRDDDEDLSAVRGAGAWAVRMLLATGSAEVRSEAGALVRNIAADGERRRLAVLSLLAEALPDACDCANSAEAGVGDGAATCDEYFDTFASVTDGGDEDAAVAARGYLRSRGTLTAVVREMGEETARLGRAEAAAFVGGVHRDADSGALAGRIAEVLARLVADVETTMDETAATRRLAKRLASTPGAIATATRCVLMLRSLVGSRTSDATAAERTLSALVVSAVDASAEARKMAIAAAVAEARRTGPAPLDPPLGEPVVGDDGERGDGERGLEKEGSVVEVSSPPPAPAGHVLSWLPPPLFPPPPPPRAATGPCSGTPPTRTTTGTPSPSGPRPASTPPAAPRAPRACTWRVPRRRCA